MFPKDAHFICRKCLHQFIVPDKLFVVITENSNLTCPFCGHKNEDTKLLNTFFDFYPRLINMIKFVELEGFLLENWKAGKYNKFGSGTLNCIFNMSFICQICGKTHTIHTNADDEDITWTCQKCGLIPQKMVTEGFLHSFNEVHRAQYILGAGWFQLDLFSPVGKDPIQFIPPVLHYHAEE